MESPPEQSERESELLWIFDLALWLKIVNGSLEVISALFILIVPPSIVLRLTEFSTGGDVTGGDGDYVGSSLLTIAKTSSVQVHHLFALYLILHGGVKILLVLGIFAKKRLAYPLFMLALTLFGIYEAYRGVRYHDTLISILALLDLVLAALTLHEYRRRYPRTEAYVV